MDVSEDLLRELVYGLNAALLRGFSSDQLAVRLLEILDTEGPRYHEATLLADLLDATELDATELEESLQSVLQDIVDELDDAEDPWSAHRMLDLLAEESFWPLEWTPSTGLLPLPPRAISGIALPAIARPALVGILDALELTLFEARQANRSVHDPVPARLFDAAMDHALASIRQLAHDLSRADRDSTPVTVLIRPPNRTLPGLREALTTLQHWKLSVEFDAHPDEDDGEWTLRVLERLYSIEWRLG